jgi:hypothetical protein
MKKLFYLFASLSLILAACGSATPVAPTATATATDTATVPPTPTETSTPTETPTPLPSPTPAYPVEGYGPSNFPSNVDPLTGLKVADPTLLDRRPMLIKVANIPRNNRPQWGLSLADLVFEYYTEEGATRFAPIFLGNNADTVGPIRSGRFIDNQLVEGYKAIFVFGSAYVSEWNRFVNSDYANRLVIEGITTPLTRYEPNGADFLVANTSTLSAWATTHGVDGRQNLDGMSFNLTAPSGGLPVTQVFVRYSGVVYNRWDFDPATGKYLRFADAADDFNNNDPQYKQLTDRLTSQPIAFDNLVVLYASYELYSPGIYDIQLNGTGDGYAFRDGQANQVIWQRNSTDVVSLTNPDGTPFSFKPGTTWFEVMGVNSTLQQAPQIWRFTHYMP